MSGARPERVALVTGATSDIGAAVARELSAAGVAVAVHFHSDRGRAEGLARELGRALPVGADVSSYPEVEAMAARISAELAPPAIVVNAAAHVRFERFMESDPVDWKPQLDVTLLGALNVCRVFGGAMIDAGWGRIVSIAAEGALVGEPALAVASVAKAGLLGLTRTLARELGPHGVAVNAVSPGFVPTAGVPEAYRRPERLEAIGRHYPMGRLGAPRDIAAAVGFLCSDAAGYVSGQTLSVSGGYSVR